jgi:sulfhydrogenase subunit beta (sulfur reductase)
MEENHKVGKFPANGLNVLFRLLHNKGYTLIGPKLDGKCITYDEIQTLNDLPQGWSDFQEKGTYRLQKRDDNAYFGYNIGSRSFKQFLFPPREKIFTIEKGHVQPLSLRSLPKLALIGVRSCELHAIQIQDKVFMSEPYIDVNYQQRRENAFIVTLNCHTAAKTCFCVSMNTGPEVSKGYDLNLSEILTDTEHYFICESGSKKGRELFEHLPTEKLQPNDLERNLNMIDRTAQQMGRHLDTTQIKEKLYNAHNHPHWNDVAQRCLNCSNCALACPTCFCSRNEDVSDLSQQISVRTKVWDTCFSQEYSLVHGASVRESSKSRYRQWLTHKLGSWHDQFETSGCVGCGRCITWCPVGIDITEEFKEVTS